MMISTYKHKKITWIDLENPTSEEVRKIIEKYNIDPVVGNELLSPSAKPHINFHDDYIYLILQFPTPDSHKTTNGNMEEVDFIIGTNYIITARYNVVDAVLQFAKTFEVNSVLEKNNLGEHSGHIFFHMIINLYKSLLDQIENIKNNIEIIEDKVFSAQEAEMVIEISKINRKLINFKETISLHYDILKTFQILGAKLFDIKFENNLRLITSEYIKVQNALENTKEYLDEIRKTNDSLLTTKQNEIMKILTVMAFITFPMTVITGVFGMNTENTPITSLNNGFWIIVSSMLILAISFFVYFRWKKWL